MNDHGSSDDMGFLPAIGVGTLFVFYMIWAAMHDIAHSERYTSIEYAVLGVTVPAFTILYRMAISCLTSSDKAFWLAGLGLLLLLYDVGAVNAVLHAKCAADPKLNSVQLPGESFRRRIMRLERPDSET